MSASPQKPLSRSALVISSDIISRVLGFSFLVYAARTLGPTGYGTYAFILSLIALLAFLPDFGLSSITVRGLARSPDEVSLIFWMNIWLRLPLWLLFLAVLQVSLILLGRSDMLYVSLLFALGTFGATIAQVTTSITNAFERYGWLATLSLLYVGVTVVLGALVLGAGYGLVGLAIAAAIASALHAVIAVAAAVRIGRVGTPQFPGWQRLRALLRDAFPLGLSTLFVNMHSKIDRILIGLFMGDVSVGWYDAAYRFLDGSMIVPRGVVVVLFPYLSRAPHGEPGGITSRMINRGSRLMFAMALPLAVGLTFLAPSLVTMVFGPDYRQSTHVLRLLIWAVVFQFPNALIGNALVAANRQSVVARIVGISLLINVLLNFALIPKWGLAGAALATIAAEAWGFAAVAYDLGRHLRSFQFLREATRPGLVAFLLGILLLWLRAYPFPVLLAVLVVAYLALSLLLRVFTLREFRALVYARGR